MFSFAKRLVKRLDGADTDGKNNLEGNNSYFKQTLSINNGGYALRVVHVEPHSRAHAAGLESWFDFIIGFNGKELPMVHPQPAHQYTQFIADDGTLKSSDDADVTERAGLVNYGELEHIFQDCISTNKPLQCQVWSAKGGTLRDVYLSFDTSATTSADSGHRYFYDYLAITGTTVLSQHVTCATHVWRILRNHPNLPAMALNLVPMHDYVVGCDLAYAEDGMGTMLVGGGEALLSRAVLEYYNRHATEQQQDTVPITFYVYNSEHDVLRPVTVELSRAWSHGQNRGLLGCDVGYGLLHQIPQHRESEKLQVPSKGRTPEAEAGKADEACAPGTRQEKQDMLTDFTQTKGTLSLESSLQPRPLRKKRTTGGLQGANGISDIMNEELAKSKKQDSQGSSVEKPSLVTPPPPPHSQTALSPKA